MAASFPWFFHFFRTLSLCYEDLVIQPSLQYLKWSKTVLRLCVCSWFFNIFRCIHLLVGHSLRRRVVCFRLTLEILRKTSSFSSYIPVSLPWASCPNARDYGVPGNANTELSFLSITLTLAVLVRPPPSCNMAFMIERKCYGSSHFEREGLTLVLSMRLHSLRHHPLYNPFCFECNDRFFFIFTSAHRISNCT